MSFQSAEQCIRSGSKVRLLKFGASWCKPCSRIRPVVDQYRQQLDPDIIFMDVDIDEDMDIYALLKAKRIVGGVPSLVLYVHGNNNPLSPDYVVTGTDLNGIRSIFNQAVQSNIFA